MNAAPSTTTLFRRYRSAPLCEESIDVRSRSIINTITVEQITTTPIAIASSDADAIRAAVLPCIIRFRVISTRTSRPGLANRFGMTP